MSKTYNDDALLEHLANFFMHQFGEDAMGVAEWMSESEGIEGDDVDAFVEAVKNRVSL